MVENVPEKLFYRIGEVSRILGVPPYVLRYWEREFPALRPFRASSRQRLYRRNDLEMLLEIRRLLYEEKYTIAGARKKLRQRRLHPEEKPITPSAVTRLKEDLLALRRLLD
ncbi:MAG: MerR family transcriptional regulator [Deltaproteobacteria bacterium]|nr:MerR family transcriptional regulator [Deltaproteobacteria bacterium]